jgi:PRTRC genetic system protein E
MFADLHALAQSATLLIAVSAEGDLLRVGVTPTNPEDKTKAHQLRPISLLGTPAELDADFGAALIAWQAPRKSLVEQAQDAASGDDEEASADKKAKPSQAKAKPAEPAPKERTKPGPKKKSSEPDAGAATPTQQDLAGSSTDGNGDTAAGVPSQSDLTGVPEPEFQLQPPPVENSTDSGEPKGAPEPAPEPAPVVDTKTLDLF